MKKQVLFSLLITFMLGAMAQTVRNRDMMDPIDHHDFVQQQKQADRFLELEEACIEMDQNRIITFGTELDSIVYYQFISEFDSIRASKKEFEFDELGILETRIEYLWDEDNVAWIYFEKKDYFYQDEFETPSYEMYRWNIEQAIWENYRKVSWIFDGNENPESYTDLRWNIDLEEWDKYIQIESTYNENGDLLTESVFEGDEQNAWRIWTEEIRSYNDDGFLETSTLAFWDEDINDLEFYQKEAYSYSVSGLVEERLYSLWINNDWSNSIKSHYFYTETDKNDSVFNYIWQANEWLDYSYMKFSFDEDDNTITRDVFQMEDNQWSHNEKTEMEYDDNNNTILYIRSRKPYGEEELVPEYKTESQYDENSAMLMTSNYYWNVGLAIWEGHEKFCFTHDNEGDQLTEIKYLWDESSVDWLLDQKGYYYRSLLDGIDTPVAIPWITFPNPVQNSINIQIQSSEKVNASIISMSGKVMMIFELSGMLNSVSMENLPKGVYFLRIEEGGHFSTKKIIKG